MLKHYVAGTLIGIIAVSIWLSFSSSSFPEHQVFIGDSHNVATDSDGWKSERSLFRSVKSASEEKRSKSRHEDAPYTTKDRSDSNTSSKKGYEYQDGQGEGHEASNKQDSIEPKPYRGKGKTSKGSSKGEKRKKESRDPKKSVSKLKTEKRDITSQARAPTPSPPVGWRQRTIQVPQFTLSFGAPQASAEPLPDEYSAVLARTVDFFSTYLSNYFLGTSNVFTSIDLENVDNRFRNEESSQFNILMSFNAKVTYSRSQNPPTAQQHFNILRDAISPKYILDYVRPVGGTFASVDMVVLGPIIATIASP